MYRAPTSANLTLERKARIRAVIHGVAIPTALVLRTLYR